MEGVWYDQIVKKSKPLILSMEYDGIQVRVKVWVIFWEVSIKV